MYNWPETLQFIIYIIFAIEVLFVIVRICIDMKRSADMMEHIKK